MTSAATLVVFAATVAALLPRLLAATSIGRRAPRLALLAWQCAAGAAVLALALAGASAMLHWGAVHDLLGAAWQVCLNALRGAHGPASQAVSVAGLAVLAAVIVRLVLAWRRVVARAKRQRREHRGMLRLAAGISRDEQVVVMTHPEPAAYLVPGRPSKVVLTTGALWRLAPDELAAVLAHEQAHAAGRHHWLLGAARMLCRAFPLVPLFVHTARQTARLVEVCADEAATRRHPRLVLARALVTMAAPAEGPAADLPRYTGGETAERLHRLLYPPRPLPAPVWVLAAAAFVLLPVLPVAITLVGRAAGSA